MNNELLNTIRLANKDFQDFIEQVAQKGEKVVESRGAVRRLGKVNLRLNEVSKSLSTGFRPPAQAREAEYEVLKYRDNLKTLRGVMETLQFSLLAEKARLENVRANLTAARAWATSLREIS